VAGQKGQQGMDVVYIGAKASLELIQGPSTHSNITGSLPLENLARDILGIPTDTARKHQGKAHWTLRSQQRQKTGCSPSLATMAGQRRYPLPPPKPAATTNLIYEVTSDCRPHPPTRTAKSRPPAIAGSSLRRSTNSM
jgi:hypothetical protein